jgi:hypothetical protein
LMSRRFGGRRLDQSNQIRRRNSHLLAIDKQKSQRKYADAVSAVAAAE